MFIHVFAFRWKPETTVAQKERVSSEIKALPASIPEVLACHAGANVSPRGGGYAFGGVMQFADKAAFETYNAHPVHQALLGWLLPLIDALELDLEG